MLILHLISILLSVQAQCWENFWASLDRRANAKKFGELLELSQVRMEAFPGLRDNRQSNNQSSRQSWSHCRSTCRGSASYKYPSGISSHDLVLYFFSSGNPSSRECEYPLDKAFTIAKLQLAISTRKITSPGEDKICYAMLKNQSKSALKHLLLLLNSSWSGENSLG